MSAHVFLVAVEASADALGAALMRQLRQQDRAIRFSGIGGPLMAQEGLISLFDPTPLAIIGMTEVLRVIPLVLRRAAQAADAALAAGPDIAVLIDAWGFTTQIAKRLKARGARFPVLKYVGPQVWAARPGRARKIAAMYDGLIALFEFERPFYAPYALPIAVSGMAALQTSGRGDGAAFRRAHGLEGRVLLLAPGSRPGEIQRVAPVLEDAAAQICAACSDVQVVCCVAPSVREAVEARAQNWGFPHFLALDPAQKHAAFAASDIALAASGTVTSEIAMQSVPVIVGYRVGALTAALMRPMFKAPFINLMNIAAGRMIVPEFVQEAFTSGAISAAALQLLGNPRARELQIAAQEAALDRLGRQGCAEEIAAQMVLATISRRKSA